MDLPTGVVTFLFTDIEGSTRLFHQLGDGYQSVLDDHRRLIRAAFAGRGVELTTEGDSFFIAFAKVSDAVAACLDAQRGLDAHPWPEGVVLRVRMGLHTGEAVPSGDDYVALAVHQAARVANAAHGGQVILSAASAEMAAASLPPGCTVGDLGAFRLRDFTEPLHLYQLFHRDLPAAFPPLRTPSISTTLPTSRTTFVGRDDEVATLSQMVSDNRALTVTGTGGTGKSRLTAEVAARLGPEFGDGVYWVELASCNDPDLVSKALAESLGVQEQPGRLLAHTVADHLCTKRALVVLDNCEHLLDACAGLVDDLLGTCDRLVVVATSREPLGVGGEVTYRVPSLLDSAAAQLFVDRARLAKPGFAIDEGNAEAIAQLCTRLDGIPLAIELAASRVRSLPVAELAARIDDRFSLLSGGSRTALPRQQTLRGMVDWSYDLLHPDEKRVFACLAAFAGSFTLDAAEAVGPPEVDTVSVLADLVDKSLVVLDERERMPRYRLLQTIRHYAVDKLIESGMAAEARTRHRDWHLDMAARAEAEVIAKDGDILDWTAFNRWTSILESQHDDVRAAIDWTATLDDPATTMKMVCALAWFWLDLGHWTEGRSRVEAALAAFADASDDEVSEALNLLGQFAWNQGDFASGADYASHRLELVRPTGDLARLRRALNQRAVNLWQLGRFDEAETDYREILELAEADGDELFTRLMLNNLGLNAQSRGDLDEAEKHFTALHQMSEGGWRGVLARFRLGVLALARGDVDQAASMVAEMQSLTGGLPNVFVSHLAGEVARREKRWDDARGDYEAAAGAYGSNRDGRAWELLHVGRVAMDEGDFDLARRYFDEALADFRQLGDLVKIAESAEDHGRLALLVGDTRAAVSWWKESVAAWRQSGSSDRLAPALLELARVALADPFADSPFEARHALTECIALCEATPGYPVSQRVLAAALELQTSLP